MKDIIYNDYGFDSRMDYLDSLADEYGIDTDTIYVLADLLGESEDFDGLLNNLEDMIW